VAVKSIDKDSGTIWLEDWKQIGRYQNNLVSKLTTKKVSGFSDWEGFAMANSSILLRPSDDGTGTQVLCQINYTGYNGWSGWQNLPSNELLEDKLLTAIESRAATLESGTVHESVLLPLLTLLDKVDAAFSIDASDAEISKALIEAKVETEKIKKEALTEPGLTDADESLQAFIAARKAQGADRSTLLEKARKSLASARRPKAAKTS
jgi:hypothetical protein